MFSSSLTFKNSSISPKPNSGVNFYYYLLPIRYNYVQLVHLGTISFILSPSEHTALWRNIYSCSLNVCCLKPSKVASNVH